MPDSPEPPEGDGAARVPLSETIGAVLDELDRRMADLEAIRYRLRQQELPDELQEELTSGEMGPEDLPRPAEQARKIAADLETYATALRSASGEPGDRPENF